MQDFYAKLNTSVDYLEQHLEREIDFSTAAKLAGCNLSVLQRIFPLLTGVTLSEYIRNRRLTLAGRDLIQTDYRVIDLAHKYGYQSAASFSRAFTKFHGVKPSEVRHQECHLCHFPKLNIKHPETPREISYDIIESSRLPLYGFGVQTDMQHIQHDAPAVFSRLEREHPDSPHPDYGMVVYQDGRDSTRDYEYWVLWRKAPTGLNTQPYLVPASRWIRFLIPSQAADDIQHMSTQFYYHFLPTCQYRLKPQPELEYYHDGVTEFLVPIV